VGLDLGGDSPEEVALSVVAAIVAARNERCGGLLRDRDGSIHPQHETIIEEVE
jgi:xanthine/CO dehydrogenase XdhC/CoxF family maturation factor